MDCNEFSHYTLSDPNTIKSKTFYIGEVEVSAWTFSPVQFTPSACVISSVRFCGVDYYGKKDCDKLPAVIASNVASPYISDFNITLTEEAWNTTDMKYQFHVETTMMGGRVFTSEIYALEVLCPAKMTLKDTSRSELDLYVEEEGGE
jgi:hypothetical protein